MSTTFLGRMLQLTRRRTRAAREQGGGDLGASALEWAIIAAIVVVAASVIGSVVFNLVEDKKDVLEACANTLVSESCA